MVLHVTERERAGSLWTSMGHHVAERRREREREREGW